MIRQLEREEGDEMRKHSLFVSYMYIEIPQRKSLSERWARGSERDERAERDGYNWDPSKTSSHTVSTHHLFSHLPRFASHAAASAGA